MIIKWYFEISEREVNKTILQSNQVKCTPQESREDNFLMNRRNNYLKIEPLIRFNNAGIMHFFFSNLNKVLKKDSHKDFFGGTKLIVEREVPCY